MTPADTPPQSAFIVGAARSGTSLLYKALCLHPEIAYVSNYVERCPVLPSLALLNRIPKRFVAARQKVWFGSDSNAYVYGGRRPLGHRLFPMPVEGESLFRRAGFIEIPSEVEASSDTQRQRLVRYLRSINRTSGGRVFLSKRIANSRRIPQLLNAVPTARFVSIVRDGRAVASSLSQVNWWDASIVWWYGSTPLQWKADGGDPWELCAQNWVREVAETEKGAAAVPTSQFLNLRYEALVAEPVETLERVAEFIGLSPAPVWSEAIRSLKYPDRNERWRTQLPAPVITRIEQVQAEALQRYGYPLEPPALEERAR